MCRHFDDNRVQDDSLKLRQAGCVKVYRCNSEICHLFITRRSGNSTCTRRFAFSEPSLISSFPFPNLHPLLSYETSARRHILFSNKNPLAVDNALTCQTYSSDDAGKKRRSSNTFAIVCPVKVAGAVGHEKYRRHFLRVPMPLPEPIRHSRWVNQGTYRSFPSRISPSCPSVASLVFHEPIRIIRWTKNALTARGGPACLKNEPSDDDPIYWSLQIALARW